MTEQQITAIRCAMADLIGSYQAVKQEADPWCHDWDSHIQTIQEMAEAFPDLETEFKSELDKLEEA